MPNILGMTLYICTRMLASFPGYLLHLTKSLGMRLPACWKNTCAFAPFLQGFCDELKRTVAYVGTQLEERGERVNWRKLDGDLKDKGQGSVLHTMGTLYVIHPGCG